MKLIQPQHLFTGGLLSHGVTGVDPREGQTTLRNEYVQRFIQPDTTFLLSNSRPGIPFRRLVLLVPVESFPVVELCSRIRRFALAGITLLFVTRATNEEQELAASRQLALLENISRSAGFSTSTRLVKGSTWLKAVNEAWQEGDLVVTLADHKVPRFFVWPAPLGKKLYSHFHIPVLILHDVHIWEYSAFQKVFRELLAWFFFVGVILSFALLQVQIERVVKGWLNPVLILLSVLAELGLIWMINRIG